MLKLFGLEDIKRMMGATEPIEGCLVVEVNLQPMQVAFTNEQPSDDMKYFQYEYDLNDTACIPLFAQPVYGVFLGSVQGGIPLAILSQARGAKFGVASFRGGESRFNLLIHEAAQAAFRNRSVRLGDSILVHFPYDPQKVEWAKKHGGKFFSELKVWVFPAEMEEGLDNLVPCGVITTMTPRRSSLGKRRLGEKEKTMEREYHAQFDCPLCGAEVKVTGKALMPAYIKREVNAQCEGCGAWSRWRTTATEEDWFLDLPIFAESNLPITPEGGKFVELAHSMILFEMQKDRGE